MEKTNSRVHFEVSEGDSPLLSRFLLFREFPFRDEIHVGQEIDAVELLSDGGRVRDENERHVFVSARIAQHVDHYLLIADVDVRRRLVREHEFRLASARATETRC